MSGLESIALAVAHLEEQRELQEAKLNHQQHQESPVSMNTSFSSPPIPPPPQAPTRVVSTDDSSVSSTSQQSTQASANASLNANSNNNNKARKSTFGYILADPLKWLQKTYDRTPLQPSANEGAPITKVESGDVLCGRGGETNHHPGNIQYRALVKAFQPHYVSAKRREKPLIAKCIVYSVRQAGGRFLKRTTENEWVDVGNTKAREKTSQALREGAPELRGGDKKQHALPQAPTTTTTPTVTAFNLSQLQYPTPSAAQPQVDTQLFSAFMTPLRHALSRGNGTARVVVTPPQQRYSPVVTTSTATQSVVVNTSGAKRPASIVSSDSHSDSDSISDTATTASNNSSSPRGGPRLKRFKKRVEEEGSSV